MNRSNVIAALALAASSSLLPTALQASDRALPMQFDLRVEGPAGTCGNMCRTFVAASGAITSDTPRHFMLFAQKHDLSGATVVLNSDGGSVHGAIALGRELRQLKLATTVGTLIDLPSDGQEPARATLSPQADCESMCAFVLLGGVRRSVPPEARVMVHQIWLGDRREDPTAVGYSAEDLVLVQRDIGRLARYTADMGASADLLELALRIPPWEPMHALTRDELRLTKLTTEDAEVPDAAATVAAASPASVPQPNVRAVNSMKAAAVSEQKWSLVDRSGVATLARRHPLTVEGEEIGSFDLIVACGSASGTYDVSYIERRHRGEQLTLPAAPDSISLRVGNNSAALRVVSSERRIAPDELVTYATAEVPAALIDAFAAMGSRSMVIKTQSAQLVTGIRLGNTGASQNLPRLSAGCRKPLGDRAELLRAKTGGLAAVK
ncbi:MAG TPA: hypothetical protein VFB29_13455 [Pseudolabrys sp.]|nr:hypothetical protein [Pseudolabrys sp.]